MFFSSHRKIAIDRALHERLAEAAEGAGYSSADEFIRHTLEKAAAEFEETRDRQQVEKQFRGLGYLE